MRLTGNTLSIIGCVCVIITTCYIYRTAKRNSRNAVKWAFVNLIVGFVFQFALPLLIASAVAFGVIISKGTDKDIDRMYAKYGFITDITILILNFVGIGLIARRISKIPEDEIFILPPPAPPTFDGK